MKEPNVDDITTILTLSLGDLVTVEVAIEMLLEQAPTGEFRRSLVRCDEAIDQAKDHAMTMAKVIYG
jgi:hypothetical protein